MVCCNLVASYECRFMLFDSTRNAERSLGSGGVVCLDFVWLGCPGPKVLGFVHSVWREIVGPELSQNHHSDLWDFNSAAVAHCRTQVRVAFL